MNNERHDRLVQKIATEFGPQAANDVHEILTKYSTSYITLKYEHEPTTSSELPEELSFLDKLINTHTNNKLLINPASEWDTHANEFRSGGKITVYDWPFTDATLLADLEQTVMEPHVNHNRSNQIEYFLRKGERVHPRLLREDAKRLLCGKPATERVYMKRTSLHDHTVYIGIDKSTSSGRMNRMGMQVQAAYMLTCAFNRLQMKTGLYVHSAKDIEDIQIGVIKATQEPWSLESRAKLASVAGHVNHAGGENKDGVAIRFLGSQLQKEATQQKTLILLSDGLPYIDNSRYVSKYAIADTTQALSDLRSRGVNVIYLSIASSSEGLQEIAGASSLFYRFYKPSHLIQALPGLCEKVVFGK